MISLPCLEFTIDPHHPIPRLQNVRHKQISWKTVILKGFLVHIGLVPPGQRWPWKRGSGRRLLFLFPGPWCGPATFYHSHTFAKIQHSKLPALDQSHPEDSHYWWLITSKHAPINFINPPPLHELFHRKIPIVVLVRLTPRSTYQVHVEVYFNTFTFWYIHLTSFISYKKSSS